PHRGRAHGLGRVAQGQPGLLARAARARSALQRPARFRAHRRGPGEGGPAVGGSLGADRAVGWAKSIARYWPRGHGAHAILPTRNKPCAARLCPPYAANMRGRTALRKRRRNALSLIAPYASRRLLRLLRLTGSCRVDSVLSFRQGMERRVKRRSKRRTSRPETHVDLIVRNARLADRSSGELIDNRGGTRSYRRPRARARWRGPGL